MLSLEEAIEQAKRETQGIDSNGQMSLEDAISIAKEENSWFHPVDWANATAIGAADMLTTNLIGGAGLAARGLGWLWEQITPWNGIDKALAEELSNLGFTPDEINKLAYNNSWLTDTGNTLLQARNVFNSALDYAQQSTIGDNPDLLTRAARGAGTTGGHILTGLALGGTPLMGALWHSGSEAISEAAGQLADNYAEGYTGNDALGAAVQSFGANMALNFGLDRFMGPFSKLTNNTLNPYLRRLYSLVGEVGNEVLQEPSQEIIGQAADYSLQKKKDFFPTLWDSAIGNNNFKNKGWWDMFKQLAPEVALSTLMSMGTGIGAEFASSRGRQNIQNQYEASQKLKELGIDTVKQGEDYLKDLITQRSQLQPELDALLDTNADPNIDNSARIQELTNSISEINDKLNNFLPAFSNFYDVFGDENFIKNYFNAPNNYGESDLDYLKAYRDSKQDELTSIYQSMTGDLDTDIENLNKAQELQALIGNLDDSINTFWRNPDINFNTAGEVIGDYYSEQINQDKQYEPTVDYPTRETAAKNYPEGMFVRIDDENAKNTQPEPEQQQLGFFDRVKSLFGLGQNNSATNNTADDEETFDYEDDTQIRDIAQKIYRGIKGFNINNEQAKFVSHIIATGARHFASYADMSVDDYLQTRGFKIVYNTIAFFIFMKNIHNVYTNLMHLYALLY